MTTRMSVADCRISFASILPSLESLYRQITQKDNGYDMTNQCDSSICILNQLQQQTSVERSKSLKSAPMQTLAKILGNVANRSNGSTGPTASPALRSKDSIIISVEQVNIKLYNF